MRLGGRQGRSMWSPVDHGESCGGKNPSVWRTDYRAKVEAVRSARMISHLSQEEKRWTEYWTLDIFLKVEAKTLVVGLDVQYKVRWSQY